MKVYNLFISHSWSYDYEYYNLVDLICKHEYFHWKNYSIPPEKSVADNYVSNKNMGYLLSNQIRPSSCVIVIGGKYINSHVWIQHEIELSLYYNKPIIGILPWGIRQIQNILRENCTDIIGWNSQSIINSIIRHSI